MDTTIEHLDPKPERQKPWGTGHAILAAKNSLQEPFAAINADGKLPGTLPMMLAGQIP
jgi:UTP-glucose-1-phosphate uridylyltransferase